jgi:hypothetical protein
MNPGFSKKSGMINGECKMSKENYPRDPEVLSSELAAINRIRDLEKLQQLNEYISTKWWETGLVLLLFVSGFGFILTVSKIIPTENMTIYWFILFWVVSIVLSIILCIEFLLSKFRAIRKLYILQTMALQYQWREISEIKKTIQKEKHVLKK